MDLLGVTPEETIKIMKGLENVCYGDRLRFGVVQSGEERAPGRPYCNLPVPKGDYEKNWRGAFHKAM